MEKSCSRCKEVKPLDQFRSKGKTRPGEHHSHCRPCAAALQRARSLKWRQAHPEEYKAAMRRGMLKFKFGITPEEYDSMLAAQDGRCAICMSEKSPTPRGTYNTFAVDHDHETGRVRGLLCASCNLGLGKFSDSLYLVVRAASYLQQAGTVAVA